jgi:NAD+ diphosphatase
VLLPARDFAWDQAAEVILLGLADGIACFAADVSGLERPEEHPTLAGTGSFTDLREAGPLIGHDEGSLLAYARGMVVWHGRHRFCGVCGGATISAEAGHVRRCTNPACAALHFPRTDPAVIMLVHDGEQCLLGRQARFAPGMYSTLAGFVEPGESLEAAVAREVFEETGIRTGTVHYHSSQPWPFPSSLMLGFHAEAASRAITVQADEIEDARWFSRATLLRAAARTGDLHLERNAGEAPVAASPLSDEEDVAATLRLPRSDSIARRLVEDWIQGRLGS